MSAATFGRTVLCPLLAMLTVGPVPAQPPSPAAIPAELRPYVPRNLAGYFIGFLIEPATPRPMSQELFIRHQAYIHRQFEAGVYHLAGPLTDGGHVHGIVILSAPTREAALTIVAADPAVREGVFEVEMHPAMFPDLAAVRADYPPAPR